MKRESSEHTSEKRGSYVPMMKPAWRRSPTAALPLLLAAVLAAVAFRSDGSAADPVPRPWPDQYHAVLYMNFTSTGTLAITDLWYDWPRRRNLNLQQRQLEGDLRYDVEWDNGTSYYYTLGAAGTCRTMLFPVGIPRPDFLQEGATYLGTGYTDGFLCHVWEKLDFIWYYEDVDTGVPVRWDFFDGITSHVMTFEEGAVLDDDSKWQAPVYCFNKTKNGGDPQEIEDKFNQIKATGLRDLICLRASL